MAARKAAKTKAAPKGERKPARAPPKSKVAPKEAVSRSGPKPSGAQKVRVVIPMSYYAKNKDAVKAPFKKLGLKWGFLGQDPDVTRGSYSGKNVSAYVEYTAEHADFTLSGSDAKAIAQILDAWKELPKVDTASAPPPPAPEERALEREVKVWEFTKPARHAGEPDPFYRLRLRDWEAKDPRRAKKAAA